MKSKNLNETHKFSDGRYLLIEEDAGFLQEKLKENNQLVESSFDTENDDLIMKCILQRAGIKNRNGRIYPFPILKREVEKYKESIKQRLASGELEHPPESTISLKNTSHQILEMWWEDETLFGKLKIITSPGYKKMGICSMSGDIVATLIKEGIKVGISSRGVGSLKTENGNLIVQDDFELIGFDLVSTPSTIGAYLFQEDNLQLNKEEVNPKPANLKENYIVYPNKLKETIKNFIEK